MSQTTEQLSNLVEQLPEPVRMQILRYAQAKADLLQAQESKPKQSFLEAAMKLGVVGIVTDAPPDLSTNPAHMDGFGAHE